MSVRKREDGKGKEKNRRKQKQVWIDFGNTSLKKKNLEFLNSFQSKQINVTSIKITITPGKEKKKKKTDIVQQKYHENSHNENDAEGNQFLLKIIDQ